MMLKLTRNSNKWAGLIYWYRLGPSKKNTRELLDFVKINLISIIGGITLE